MGLLDRRWLIIPWLAVAIFAVMAASDDYARFQQDKTEQQKALIQARDVLGKTADAWVEQGREIVEHYRTEEERQSIMKSLRSLQEQNKRAHAEMARLPRTIFFPETIQAEERLADRLDKLENITQGLFQAKTDLLAAQVRLIEAPYRIQFYRRQSRYFLSIMDIINYYRSQDSLAQSESVQFDLQEMVNGLQADLGEWQQKMDLEHMDMLDDVTAINEAMKREARMDYPTYFRARWRTFSAQRALHRA